MLSISLKRPFGKNKKTRQEIKLFPVRCALFEWVIWLAYRETQCIRNCVTNILHKTFCSSAKAFLRTISVWETRHQQGFVLMKAYTYLMLRSMLTILASILFLVFAFVSLYTVNFATRFGSSWPLPVPSYEDNSFVCICRIAGVSLW